MIICAACGHQLTGQLAPVNPDFEPEYAECEQLVPRGRVWTQTNPWVAQPPTSPEAPTVVPYLVINSDDAVGLKFDPDNPGHGCCGNSSEVLNRACRGCGTSVGTAIDDCFTGYFEYFPTSLVTLTPPPTNQ